MKKIKLYNVIFPIWFLMFFPPVIFITLGGNFIIDSIVVAACFFAFKLFNRQINIKSFYTKSILKVWIFGFLADIIGSAILFLFVSLGDYLGMPYEVISAISYDPFSQFLSVIIILISMLISAAFIFLFSYRFTFKKIIQEKTLRLKLALTIAIVTMPWTFLIPTKWFYYGF